MHVLAARRLLVESLVWPLVVVLALERINFFCCAVQGARTSRMTCPFNV